MDLLESMGLGNGTVGEGRMYFAIYQDAQPGTDAELQVLAASCMAQLLPQLQGYIWQHERFHLRSSLQEPPPWTEQKTRGHQAAGAEPSSVWGTVRFGDNIEDEWFAVWLLLQLTKQLSDISVCVWDDDGEFLLIEAAVDTLPRWLNSPDKSANRVWLRGGRLHVIPPPSSRAPTLPAQPTLTEALQVLRSGVIDTHRPRVEAPILERVANFPAAARNNMMTVHCVLALRVAHVLRHEPELVAPAVEAFYTRDPDDVKVASSMRHFPPSEGMVKSAVVMSRIMYSQLRMQQHTAPRAYPMPLPSEPDFTAADLGMKLTAGLEMVVARGQQGLHQQQQQQQQTATPSMQPDAVATAAADQQSKSSSGGGAMATEQQLASNPAWVAYRKALQRRDYFQGNIPGSKAYKERMSAAVSAFLATDAYAKSSAALAAPAARVAAVLAAAPLPAGGAAEWQEAVGQLPPETPNAQLEQQLEERLERQMAKREAERAGYEAAKQQRRSRSGGPGPDAAATAAGAGGGGSSMAGVGGGLAADEAEIARRVRSFVAHSAGMEGAEVPSSSPPGGGMGAVSVDDAKLWHAVFSTFGVEPAEAVGEAGAGQLQAMLLRLSGLASRAGGGDEAETEEYDGSSTEGSSFFGDEGASSSDDGSDADDAMQRWPGGRQPPEAGAARAGAGTSCGAQGGVSAARAAAGHAVVGAADAAVHVHAAAQQQAGASMAAGMGARDMDWAAAEHGSEAGSLHVSDLSIDESEHDALSIGSPHFQDEEDERAAADRAFHAAYSQVLTEQLATTKLAETFERAPAGAASASAAAGAGSSAGVGASAGLLPVDVDLNLVHNMMRSFESQEGLPGPASNLAGLLGLSLDARGAGRSSQLK